MKQLPEHGLCSIPTLFFKNVAQELYIRLINIYLPERLLYQYDGRGFVGPKKKTIVGRSGP
jgi:hypothetical protein